MAPAPRSPSRNSRRRFLPLLGRVALVVGLAGGVTVTAAGSEPGGPPLRLAPSEVRERGLEMGVATLDALGEGLVTVRLSGGTPDPRALLDVTPDGEVAAMADAYGPAGTTLILEHADAAQLRVAVPGLLGAGFAPDGSWLALLDGSGALHRISTADGSSAGLAEGPFLGQPSVLPGGEVLVLSVPSIEAPYLASPVTVAPDGTVSSPLLDEPLVYAASPLADGSLALVVHRPDGTVVERLDAGHATLVAALPAGAIHVAVAADASQIAWEVDATGVYLRDVDGRVRFLGAGTRPRFAPDGRTVLVDAGDGAVLVNVADESRHPLAVAAAAFRPCSPECGS